MVFAPVVPAVRGFFLMVAKDRRLEGGHVIGSLLTTLVTRTHGHGQR